VVKIGTYKNVEIEVCRSGLYSVFLVNKGFFKADTLKGIKQLIKVNK
jgi:hypothetical protein